MSNDVLAPEEKLEVLERLILEDKEKALEFFRKNSHENHYNIFRELINHTQDVRRTSEYLVLIPSPTSAIGVIGLDDNYNLFCHMAPIANNDINNIINSPSDAIIRRLMGFDKHIWEIEPLGITPGVTIRLQGDITLNYEFVFEDEEEMFSTLFSIILNKIFFSFFHDIRQEEFDELVTVVSNVVLGTIKSGGLESLGYTIDRLVEIYNRYSGKLTSSLVGRIGIILTGNPETDTRNLLSKLVYYTISILNSIPNYERKIVANIGRHEIKFIGLTEGMLNQAIRDYNSAIQPANFRFRVYVLRPNTMTLIHPEHKTVSINIPRGIMTIDTLRNFAFPTNVIMRLKIVMLGPPIKTMYARAYMGREFIRGYKSVVGADFFVRRDQIIVFPLGRFNIELLIWDINHSPIFTNSRPLFYRGARAAIVFFDVTDKCSFLNLPNLINEFWRHSGGPWPVIIVGDTSNLGSKEREVPRYAGEEYARRLSEALRIDIPYIETNPSNEEDVRRIFEAIMRSFVTLFTRMVRERRRRRRYG